MSIVVQVFGSREAKAREIILACAQEVWQVNKGADRQEVIARLQGSDGAASIYPNHVRRAIVRSNRQIREAVATDVWPRSTLDCACHRCRSERDCDSVRTR